MARDQLTTARLRALLGATAVVSQPPAGPPSVAPDTADACALVLRSASERGWRVRVAGAGSWMPPDSPADLVLTTTRLRGVRDVDPADLVATADAGVPWSDLQSTLAEHEVWIAHDLPGGPRTLGSAVATATAGPLRAGLGALRDQIVGLTLVTGDGRIVRLGGRVMKNVAGFDVAKLAAGGFGAFGLIASLHLRLRAVPRADRTVLTRGPRDTVLDAARRIYQAGLQPAALEVFSPRAAGGSDWTLAVRCLGTDAHVDALRAALAEPAALPLRPLPAADAAAFWRDRLAGAGAGPVTLRIGALPESLDAALDTIAHHLDETVDDWISVTIPAGTIRWCGAARAEHLRLLRRVLAEREMPLTIERAPWPVRSALGHFGAYREGVARLVAGLRRVFDPAGILVAPLDRA